MNETAVLISDGNDSREILTELLEDLNFLVADVESAEQAAVVLRSFKCHLVLWDLHDMRDREAPLAIQLLESIAPEIPVVLLASTNPREERLVLAAKARKQVHFLTKPVAADALRKTIESTLLQEGKRLGV